MIIARFASKGDFDLTLGIVSSGLDLTSGASKLPRLCRHSLSFTGSLSHHERIFESAMTWKTAIHPRVAKLRELIASRKAGGVEVEVEDIDEATIAIGSSRTKVYCDKQPRPQEVEDYLKAPNWQKQETRRLLPAVNNYLLRNADNAKRDLLRWEDGTSLVKTSGSVDPVFMHYVKTGEDGEDDDEDVQRWEILGEPPEPKKRS